MRSRVTFVTALLLTWLSSADAGSESVPASSNQEHTRQQETGAFPAMNTGMSSVVRGVQDVSAKTKARSVVRPVSVPLRARDFCADYSNSEKWQR